MRFDTIIRTGIRTGQQFLQSEQGRTAGRKVADVAAAAARKAAPKQAATIDRAQRAAHDYLDRRPGAGGSGGTIPGSTR